MTFLSLGTVDMRGPLTLDDGSCRGHCGGFSSIPDLHPLGASNSLPLAATTKNVSKYRYMSLGEQSCPPLRTAALEPSALEPWLSTSGDYRNHSSSFGFFTMVMLRPTLDQLNQTLWAWKPSLGGCGSSLGDANVQLVWKTTALSP